MSREIVEELYEIMHRAKEEDCVFGDGWRAMHNWDGGTFFVVSHEPAGWGATVELLFQVHCAIQLSAAPGTLLSHSGRLCSHYRVHKDSGLYEFTLGSVWLHLSLEYIVMSYEALAYALEHGWEEDEGEE